MSKSAQSEDTTYILSHRSKQTVEHERLNRQHNLIQQTFLNNQLIHPTIPLSSLQGGIADIACGTGIWLEEMAHALSHRDTQANSNNKEEVESSSVNLMPQFVGFDMNVAAFPPNPAAGIRLVQHDCTEPFDARYLGQFDLVNLRGLAYAITEEKLARVLENVSFLLKPGGYLQWTESEISLFKFFPETPDLLESKKVIDNERRARGLVPYLPHFMLQSALSLRGDNEKQILDILHFNLRPGGFCQDPVNTEVNLQFSEILTESVSLFLQSALMRVEQEEIQILNATAKEDKAHRSKLDQLQRLKLSVSEVFAAGGVKMGGIFPHLVAQKHAESL